MIKEKYLVPGRVLSHRTLVAHEVGGQGGQYVTIETWIACMVISYIPIINRRHTRSAARRDGWDVLVFWFDERRARLESVRVPPEDSYGQRDWRNGW